MKNVYENRTNYKRKFIDLRNIEALKDKKKERAIAIMLDLQGTLDDMTDDMAQVFMEQLEKLRRKFSAKKVLLNISTHIDLPSTTLDKYMTILARNLKPNIILDDATYLFGTYNFFTKECKPLENGKNNYNKTAIFEERYLSNNKDEIVWFGIVDDALNPNYFKKWQNHMLMAEFIPSLKKEEDKKYDNLMCVSSLTSGFLGVIECFHTYLQSIKDIPSHSLIEVQSNILPYLSKDDITILFCNRRFDDILRYIKEGKLEKEDYEVVIRELSLTLKMVKLNKEELDIIRKIFYLTLPHIKPDNKHLLVFKELNESLK